MDNSGKGFLAAILIPTVIYGVLLFGYGRCAYQFVTSDFEPSYKREVIYGVGLVTPIGPIIGLINIKDGPTDSSD